jgi:hypothetical protein
MTDEASPTEPSPAETSLADPSPASERAEKRAAAKTRREKALERQDFCFRFLVSGYSREEIAKALGVSVATVRRMLDKAIDERRLDTSERFARVQVARLTKALCHADDKLERGDIRAFEPYVKLVAALDRYHGLGRRGIPLPPPVLPPGTEDTLGLPPPLALTHAAPPLDPQPDPVGDDLGE